MNLRPYLQLLRLPNLFTALADIALAGLALNALPQQIVPFLLLALASVFLYSGGLVWNDFFDLEQDRRERPLRPLPSGRVSRRQAGLLGTSLLAGGVGLAALADRCYEGFPTSGTTLAALLVGAILLYDSWLKRTWAGPLAMGGCRFLNILLGLTVAGTVIPFWGYHLALVVGLYVAGITWFARKEARVSSPAALLGGGLVMLGSLVVALLLPARFDPSPSSPLFPFLLVGFAFGVGFPLHRAMVRPTPAHVQAAVTRALRGLVVLDAVLATALAGSVGLVLLVLLVPILLLSRWRWLYTT